MTAIFILSGNYSIYTDRFSTDFYKTLIEDELLGCWEIGYRYLTIVDPEDVFFEVVSYFAVLQKIGYPVPGIERVADIINALLLLQYTYSREAGIYLLRHVDRFGFLSFYGKDIGGGYIVGPYRVKPNYDYEKFNAFKKVVSDVVRLISFSQTVWINNLASWTQTINGIRSGDNYKEYIIILTGNISVPSITESTFGSVVGLTVTIAGNGTLSPSNNGSLLRIGAKQTVIVRDITLRGRNANNASVVTIAREGIFRMEGNASVSGNIANYPCRGGGGVYVKGGTFTMQGNASILGNTSNDGGGVYVEGGTFTMQGNASISGNIAEGFGTGGGVCIKGGTFAMHGSASISGNTGSGGGGVLVSENGTFTMQDSASVSGNTSRNGGGGVCLSNWLNYAGVDPRESESRTTFIMRGNTSILGNTSRYGGGVFVGIGTFTMQGSASISGNKSSAQGGGVYVGKYETFIKTGGTIYGDNAKQNLKNTVISRIGHVVYKEGNEENGNWRNVTAGPTMNTDSRNFWLNDGKVVIFPSGFKGQRNPPNDFNNYLFFTENTMSLIKISNNGILSKNNYLWVLQRSFGNVYTFKCTFIPGTRTLTIKLVFCTKQNSK
jgi:hypothetical protein